MEGLDNARQKTEDRDTPLDPLAPPLFGGSGDLAMRKLLPALFYRHRDGGDTRGWRIIGTGRNALSREQYLNLAQQSCRTYIAAKDFSEAAWSAFAQHLDYLALEHLYAGAEKLDGHAALGGSH